MENIKLMVDANFAYHIHTYLKGEYNKCIDWKAFLEFIKVYVKDTFNINDSQLALDAKYFTSTKPRTDDAERDFFYNSLDHANVGKKATKLKSDGEYGLKEDAVDVFLSVTAMSDYYRARDEDKYSFFILFAGDSDFVPLITELKSLGIKTVIVYLDCKYNGTITKAGQALLMEGDERINLQDLLAERVNELRKSVFKEYSERSSHLPNHRFRRIENQSIPYYPNQQSRETTIVSWNSIYSSMDACRHYPYGYVLASELGEKLKISLRVSVLPRTLREILEEHSEKLDFEENPFKVRLKPSVYRAC